MDKDHDLWYGGELGRELTKDSRSRLSSFVKEDSESFDGTERVGLESIGKLHRVVGVYSNETGCGESVFCLSKPLLFFAIPPQKEDRCQYEGESKRKPSSLRYLCKGR